MVLPPSVCSTDVGPPRRTSPPPGLRATDIGITWQGGHTFLYGVRVAGPEENIEDTRPLLATSTPYPLVREHPSCGMSTPRPLRPVCMEIPEMPTHRTGQEGRPGYRPAAPIQRFNNKSIGCPARTSTRKR